MNFNILSSNAVAVNADGTYEIFSGEAWAYAGQMTLLGMLMVFAVLAILWGVLAIFKLIFAGKSKPKKEKAPKAVQEAVQEAVAAEEVVEETDDGELIAVITAAVAAYRAEENVQGVSDGAFRVVSFRRANSGRAWNKNK